MPPLGFRGRSASDRALARRQRRHSAPRPAHVPNVFHSPVTTPQRQIRSASARRVARARKALPHPTVHHHANLPPAHRPTGVFRHTAHEQVRDLKGATARHRATKKVRAAARKLPRETRTPALPDLKHATPHEKRAYLHAAVAALKLDRPDLGLHGVPTHDRVRDVLETGDRRTRHVVRKAVKYANEIETGKQAKDYRETLTREGLNLTLHPGSRPNALASGDKLLRAATSGSKAERAAHAGEVRRVALHETNAAHSHRHDDIAIAGIPVEKALHTVGRKLAPALKPAAAILRVASLPGRTAEAGIHYGLTGEDPKKALARGVTGSDILADLGVHNKAVKAIAGFGVDVATDPLSYVTAGATGAARAAAAKEFARVETKALRAGMTPAGAKGAARAAARRAAEKAPDAKRYHVRVGTQRRHVEIPLATVQRRPAATKGVRGAKDEVVAAMNPRKVPAGSTPELHLTVKRAEREQRALAGEREHAIVERAKRYEKALNHREHELVNDAIEGRTFRDGRYVRFSIGQLPEHLRPIAKRLRDDEKYVRRLAAQQGVGGKRLKNYRAHVRRQDVEGNPLKTGAFKHTTSVRVDHGRTIRKTLAELRREAPHLFTDDVGVSYAAKAVPKARAGAQNHVYRTLLGTGRKLTEKAHIDLGGSEAVYHFPPNGAPRKLVHDDKVQVKEIAQAARSHVDRGQLLTRAGQLHREIRVREARDGARARKHLERVGKLDERIARKERELTAMAARPPRSQTEALKLAERIDRREATLRTLKAKRARQRPDVAQRLLDKHEAKVADLRQRRAQLIDDAQPPKPGQYVILNQHVADRVLDAPSFGGRRLEIAGRAYDRGQAKLKTLLTVVRPAYHGRNFVGDLQQAYLEQNPARIAYNLRHSRRALTQLRRARHSEQALDLKPVAKGATRGMKVRGKFVTYDDLVKRARRVGAIDTGLYGGDIPDQLHRARGAGGKIRPVERARTVGQYRENLVRLTTFLHGLERDMTDREAADVAMELHFDYGDLSPIEQGLRRIFPFYTFTARNAPLQARKIITRPGKYGHIELAREELAKAAGLDNSNEKNYQHGLKDYEGLQVPFAIPGLKVGGQQILGYPGLPLNDLNRLSPDIRLQAEQVGAMLTGYKAPIEELFNYSLFFHDKIDQGRPVAAPAAVAKVAQKLGPGVMHELGLVRKTDKKTGKRQWYWKAKWDYAFKQVPQVGFVLGLATSGDNRRGQPTSLKLASSTGIRLAPLDPVGKRLDETYHRLDVIDSRIARTDSGTRERDRLNKQKGELEKRLGKLSKKAGYKIPLGRNTPKKSLSEQIRDEIQSSSTDPGAEIRKDIENFNGGP